MNATLTAPKKTRSRTDVQARIESFRYAFSGDVIQPEDEAYEDARLLQNRVVNRRPAAVVRPVDAKDVVRAVNFARDNGLRIAVRSGAHSLAGHSSVDGGIVIDLSLMRDVVVDPATRTARVQAGATSGDLAPRALEHGLSLSTGDTRSVGLGGLTLGGGIGWMVRKQGLTIDNLLAAEVVTADGRIVKASADKSPDLFWALRGGGGNFGIATSFTYRLHADAQVVAGVIVQPATLEVLRGYADYVVSAPEELTTIAALMHAPPAPFIPEDKVGSVAFMIMFCYAGDPSDAEAVLQPLRALASPIADIAAPMPYPAIFSFTDEATAPMQVTVRSAFLDELPDAVLAAFIDKLEGGATVMVELRGLGGAMARVPVHATAFAHRDANYFFAAIDAWEGEQSIEPHTATVNSFLELVRSHARGVYVNFLGDEGRDRVHEAYPTGTYERLAEVKRRYDPDNLFSLNQNVLPQ